MSKGFNKVQPEAGENPMETKPCPLHVVAVLPKWGQ